MRAGKPRAEALRNLVDRTGVDDIRALVGTLIQTDRFGTSVAQALRVHSDSLRTERRQRAEEQAAKTTIKMVPPLVIFVLPSIIFVTIGPAVIQLIRQLGPVRPADSGTANGGIRAYMAVFLHRDKHTTARARLIWPRIWRLPTRIGPGFEDCSAAAA